MRFSFTVPGEPQGKARARTWFDPRVGKAVSKTPENTVVYENLVKLCYQGASKGYRFPDDTPLDIAIEARFSIPKSVSKKKRALMLAGEILPTKAPDSDNIAKSVLDGIQGVCFKNDNSVVSLAVRKTYSEVPCVMVWVREVVGENSPK